MDSGIFATASGARFLQQALAAKAGLEPEWRFGDYARDRRKVMQQADQVILPSWFDQGRGREAAPTIGSGG